MGTGFFPELKWPGHGVDYPPPPSAEVKETVELYFYSLSLWDFVACSRVKFTFTFNFIRLPGCRLIPLLSENKVECRPPSVM